MAKVDTESFRIFEACVAKTGGTYAFDGETAVQGMGALLNVLREMGLDPMKTEDLKKGLLFLFNIEFINMPDLEQGRFILAPNHVSDVDAPVLGLLHPRIRIVSKSDWVNNQQLRQFLDAHYDLQGLDRMSVQSLRRLLSDSIQYFTHNNEIRHYLVFSQGTISDFNNNSVERISPIAQKVSLKTEVPIVTVFLEQPSLYHPTRIVFDEPVKLSRKDDFRQIWLERQAALQAALAPPARRPVLTQKHANNNKPGDPFF